MRIERRLTAAWVAGCDGARRRWRPKALDLKAGARETAHKAACSAGGSG